MFRMRLLACCLLTCLGAATAAQAQEASRIDELARHVPAGANALFVADLDRIVNSPQAKREQWSMSLASLYSSGLTSIPPNTRQLLVASELDLEFMQPVWEAAVMVASEAPAMEAIAQRQNGQLDTLAGRPAIAFASDAYLVKFDDSIYGSVAPANRQRTARWIRDIQQSSKSPLSPYLQEAVEYVRRGSSGSLIALDLTDIVSVEQARTRMVESEAPFIKGQDLPVDEIAEVLASLRGVMMGATYEEETYAVMRVDFGKQVGPLAPIAKPLLLKLLGDNGVLVEDLEQWPANVEGNRVTLRGKLSESGRRRLMSFIDVPAAPTTLQAQRPDGQAPEDPDDAQQRSQGYISAEYFRAIQSLLDDLRHDKRESKTIGLIGVWMDQYARKIDRLPVSGVDPALVDYSRYVSSQLREASLAIKGIGIKSRARALQEGGQRITEGTFAYGYSPGYSPYRYGRYGRYGWYAGSYTRGPNAYERKEVANRVRAEERAVGATQAVKLLAEIENATARARAEMAEKYEGF